MLEVLWTLVQVIAGFIGLAWVSATAAGMWKESRVLTAATGAVSLVAVAGLLYMGGGLAGANQLVLSGILG